MESTSEERREKDERIGSACTGSGAQRIIAVSSPLSSSTSMASSSSPPARLSSLPPPSALLGSRSSEDSGSVREVTTWGGEGGEGGEGEWEGRGEGE